ncbi:MAG: RiPP maturation radical SAM protein 1, partial [bacterium]|nr:RiPP maturation radical SAM protein 1 [bacterium]
QASCVKAGIKTRVLYGNLLYANLIGLSLHSNICEDSGLMLCERIFASTAYGDSVSIRHSIQKFSDPQWAPDHQWKVLGDDPSPAPVVTFKEWLEKVNLVELEASTDRWLRSLAEKIVKMGWRMVGCSTTFGGLNPAVALLNCIKEADPSVTTILGGALCDEEMAEGIQSLKAGIDYIVSGEGEITLPALAAQILANKPPVQKIIHGRYVENLDDVPLPDYENFAVQRKLFHSHLPYAAKDFNLPFESSRGCKYGKCTFCGLNGRKNYVRIKSADVVYESLKELGTKHPTHTISMGDTLMPLEYFETLLPRMAAEPLPSRVFYEMKVKMTLEQVMKLKDAGITEILPGIESLSPTLLRRMKKPGRVRDNIALLRYARALGLALRWNLLFGFPGDLQSEYDEMRHLLPLIHHLQPPVSMFPLILCRFSKYHTDPGEFDISRLQPAEVHRDTLPAHTDLDKIAYFLSADFPSGSRGNPLAVRQLWDVYQVWFGAWEMYRNIPFDAFLPILHVAEKTSRQYALEDTRGLPGRPKSIEIDRKEAGRLLVARPLEDAPYALRMQEEGLGVILESWFVPLATAKPGLILELEKEYTEENAAATTTASSMDNPDTSEFAEFDGSETAGLNRAGIKGDCIYDR